MAATFPLADLVVRIVGDMSQFSRDMIHTESLMKKKAAAFTNLEARGKTALNVISRTASMAGTALSTAFTISLGALAALIGGMAAFSAWALKLGTSANELRNRFYVTFGQQADRSMRSLAEFADAVGRSRLELFDMAATLQNVWTAMGFTQEESADLSITIAKLGTDIASFHDIADSDATDRLASALVGNHEALRSLGIVVTETAVKQELLNMGFRGGFDSANDQQKMLARLNIILRATNLMQNDAQRTSGSMANQFKGLWGIIKDLADAWGQALIPAVQVFVGWMRGMLVSLRDTHGSFNQLGTTMANWATQVVGWFDELMFVIGNYDLSWKALVLTVQSAVSPLTDMITEFATAGFYIFEWFTTNVAKMWDNLTSGIVANVALMAQDVVTNIQGMWDFITSGGQNFQFSNMGMGMVMKDVMEGTTKFEMPKVETRDWDQEWRDLEDQMNERRERIKKSWEPDEQVFVPPDVRSMFARIQNNNMKITVDMVDVASAWKNHIKDAFKDSELSKQTDLQGQIVGNQDKQMQQQKDLIDQQTFAIQNAGGGFY